MSGRGRFNGRSRHDESHGRGYGGGRGNYGRNDGRYRSGYPRKPERFMLSENPDVGTVNRWFREQENWAIENLPNHGVSWVVNREDPMEIPMKEPPEPPTKAEYTKFMPIDPAQKDPEAESTEEVYDAEAYDIALFMWKEDHKVWQKDTKEVKRDIRSLYGSMRTYLGEGCRRVIETEMGPDAWVEESPVELRDAVIKVFLAKNTGGSGNFVDAREQQTRFMNIHQRQGQAVTEFLSYFKEQLASLKVSEMARGVSEKKFDDHWTEKEKSETFISMLDKDQGGYWLAGFRYRGSQPPDTLDEAFQQAVAAEREFFNGRKAYDRINAYHARDSNYRGGRGSYAQAAKGRGGSKPRLQKDNDGRLLCLDHLKNKCSYGDSCKYSHKQPAEDKNNEMIEKAVKETTSPKVSFGNKDGSNLAGGGAGPPRNGK